MHESRLRDRQRQRMIVERASTENGQPSADVGGAELLTAGERVSQGRYRRADVPWGEVIEVVEGGHLPASFDGHVALYERLHPPIARWQSHKGLCQSRTVGCAPIPVSSVGG
jgi:hypothetical protein